MTASRADKSTQAEPDPIKLLVLAGQLARYGLEIVEHGDLVQWESAYPDTGATVDRFIWEFRLVVPAYGLPPESCAGLSSKMRIYLPEGLVDSVAVRTAGIDSLGNVGEWSEIGGIE
ncbi:MAG: hypothetical protein JRC86_04845 [Deltaproteobacteria bacterium]|nr:hypothetical protein [Deltaproteobacteria bacterium]